MNADYDFRQIKGRGPKFMHPANFKQYTSSCIHISFFLESKLYNYNGLFAYQGQKVKGTSAGASIHSEENISLLMQQIGTCHLKKRREQ